MKGTIETPKVAKITLSLLTHLFFDVLLTLERESSAKVVFQKQLEIQGCLKKIKTFIFDHPYATFHVEILNSTTRDKEDPLLSISFKNYEELVEDKIPLEYHIILDETFTNFEVYQSSLNGILLVVKI